MTILIPNYNRLTWVHGPTFSGWTPSRIPGAKWTAILAATRSDGQTFRQTIWITDHQDKAEALLEARRQLDFHLHPDEQDLFHTKRD